MSHWNLTLADPTALRTIIVDDSALARLMLREALSGIEGVRVVGNAAEGNAALEVIGAVEPDLIILDVEMPGMDGIRMLKEMNFRGLRTPVLMCSRLTSVGAEVTTEALLQGAYDFVCKPSGGSRLENLASLREQLTPRIEWLMQHSDTGKDAVMADWTPSGRSLSETTIAAIVIGASTGGPAALQTLLQRLDPGITLPIFVVQHIPAGFSEPLARRLSRTSSLPVVEARDGQEVVGGKVYLARGGCHMTIARSAHGARLQLSDQPAVQGCRPSVDMLMQSALEHYGSQLLAVVLTGMGRDGAAGAKAIREMGGLVFAQHPAHCSVSSMPRQTIAIAGADRVVELRQLAELINSVAAQPAS